MEFELGPFVLGLTTAFGPRIMGLRQPAGPSLFAVLDDMVLIDHPDSGRYRFRGGHRLWAAPEIPQVTYAADDDECELAFGPDSISLLGPVDAAGLHKRIALSPAGTILNVDHSLTNRGPDPVELAPWAITQLRLGGVVLMPLGRPDGALQGDRQLTVWPYTDLGDPRLSFSTQMVALAAQPGPPLKLGVGPNPQCLGYFLDGWLFTKEFSASPNRAYPDRGAVGQVFLGPHFAELESLGPLSVLTPGATASHRETWTLNACEDLEAARQRLLAC